MTGTTDLFNIANSTPAVVGPAGSGAISGGLLRPGSIDQHAFQQMLQAQQSARAGAGIGGKPVGMPILPFQNGIPTLTSAQFAALVGGPTSEAGDSDDGGAAADPQSMLQQADPNYGADLARRLSAGHAQKLANPTLTDPTLTNPAAATAAGLPPATAPHTDAIRLSGAPAPQMAALSANAAATPDDAARIFRGPKGVQPVGNQAGPQMAGTQMAGTQMASTGADAQTPPDAVSPDSTNPDSTDTPKPEATQPTASAPPPPPPSDPNLVHLKEQPDRDMQMKLRLEHKQWVVDETPGSRQLFFGADGKFGWDDVLDVINPLQHIPIISQIYRAVTGDQIDGAAELIGAIPFGPLGFVGMAGAIADLAVRDTTGKDIGNNVQAMIFGNGSGNTDNMAAKPGATPPDDAAAADGVNAADPAATQTASIEGQKAAGRYDVESERVRRG